MVGRIDEITLLKSMFLVHFEMLIWRDIDKKITPILTLKI
jgi:hypothetical protein